MQEVRTMQLLKEPFQLVCHHFAVSRLIYSFYGLMKIYIELLTQNYCSACRQFVSVSELFSRNAF